MAYLVLDGPDGGGKSTQAELLTGHLRQLGRTVHHLREPGSTPVGEALRALLLDAATGELLPLSEVLLFTAARAELVARVVAPALHRGDDVVAERCYASTLAYQCVAATPGVDFDWVLDVTRRAHGPWLPDAIYVLDVDVETAKARRSSRAADRFEGRDDAFHQRVRDAYRVVAARDPIVELVDARGAADAVQQDLRGRVQRWLR
ncbi:MAG: dTMP kinase [Planctomycetota bacterium]